MYQPCFSDMLSSESVSSVSIAPTGGAVIKGVLEERAELDAGHCNRHREEEVLVEPLFPLTFCHTVISHAYTNLW